MKKTASQSGQALITLVVFVAIAISVITAAVSVLYSNASSTAFAENGTVAYGIAESGAEEGYLQLLRHPQYNSGGSTYNETLSMNPGQASITVSGGVINSTGTYYNTVRKIQVQTSYSGGTFTVSSWKEINP